MTAAVAIVLKVFVDEPRQARYGYELMRLTGYPSGKVYPILARLQAADWLEAHWEDVDPVREGRPPRRWYRLSEKGVAAARYELAVLHQKVAAGRRLRLALRTEGGD